MEFLLVAVAAGLVVWLIVQRNRPPSNQPASTQPAPTGGGAPARANRGGPGFIGWLLIIGAGLFGAMSLLGSGDGPAQRSEANKWAAPAATPAGDPHDQTGCSASRRAIEAKLASPGTVKWVSCRVTTTAGVQTVVLAADSQNRSGGLVRSEWMTKVRDNNVESIGQMR